MAVYKDKWNGYKGDTWRVAVYYKDWKGIRRKHEKRGFATKKEALAYEREYIAKTSKDTNMGFDTFVDIYMSDIKPQIKLSTYVTKENIINAHICSYFENKSLSEITANDILQWQNALLSLRDDDGKGYSQTYLRTIQNQLNAIFNHAVKYYDLPKNPCIANKKMGKSKSKEMLFWTMDEYLKFSEVMKEKPRAMGESILTKPFLTSIGVEGLCIGIMTMTAFMIGYRDGNAVLASTMAFGTLCSSRLVHGFNCKANKPIIFTKRFWNNIYLIGAYLAGF